MDLDKIEIIELGKDFPKSRLFEDYYNYRRQILAETDPDMLGNSIESVRKYWQPDHKCWFVKSYACICNNTFLGDCRIEMQKHESTGASKPSNAFFSIDVPKVFARNGIGTALLRKIVECCNFYDISEIRCLCLREYNGFCKHFCGLYVSETIKRSFMFDNADWPMIMEYAKPSSKNQNISFEFVSGFPKDKNKSEFLRTYKEFSKEVSMFANHSFDDVYFDKAMQDFEEKITKFNMMMVTCFAKDENSKVAGFTSVTMRTDRPNYANQLMTGILREYRGKGLGMRIKASMAIFIKNKFPKVNNISTINNHENRWMININEALGYKIRSHYEQYCFNVGDLAKRMGANNESE